MKPLDKIITIIKEMMVANSSGSSTPGFSGSSPAKGPTAGIDPLLGYQNKKKKIDYRRVPKNYKSWVKSLQK